ncbi:MAG: prenyltransferase [Chloroflexi bacterium]|nr:prenyltransferase [Chloroflexota bacterium]
MIKTIWTIIRTCNAPAGAKLNTLTRWLLIVRPCVMSMTATSVLIGALLAWDRGHIHVGYTLLVLIGLLLAHAVNNMANDLIDSKEGVDTADYPRASYAPHPILDKLTTEKGLLRAIIVANLVDVLIALYLTWVRGWPVLAFALAGAFLSLGYVAPPFSFKRRGLGELVALIVWGPLMIGGTYYVLAGSIDARIWLASLPYGLMVAIVLLGKHLDKYDVDKAKGIRTLPVLLGFERARKLTMGLMVFMYVLVILLVWVDALPPWTLLVFLSLPRLRTVLRMYQQPKPKEPPPDWPVWPLWYVAIAMWLNRLVGGLFILGLLLQLIWPL